MGLIVLVVLRWGGLQNGRHSRNRGHGVSVGLGVLRVIVLVLLIASYIPRGS